jgi:hypothetical protein
MDSSKGNTYLRGVSLQHLRARIQEAPHGAASFGVMHDQHAAGACTPASRLAAAGTALYLRAVMVRRHTANSRRNEIGWMTCSGDRRAMHVSYNWTMSDMAWLDGC